MKHGRSRSTAAIAAVMLLSSFATLARGQTPTAPPGQPVRLSLGQAVRLAANQSALSQGAAQRVDAARARVTEARSALLPDVSGYALQNGRTFNTITFGLNFPLVPGQPPLFNPAGEVLGPVNILDIRARGQMNILDWSAVERLRTSHISVDAARAEAATAADNAATQAAGAYLRTLRSEAEIQARIADSTLAHEQLGIAQSQLEAGVGVALDVTRAAAQLSGVRAQLIAVRSERERNRLDLLHALNLPLSTPIELSDSLSGLVTDDLAMDEKGAVDRALRERADLRAVDEQIRVARQSITSVRAERLPSLSAFGDDGALGGNAARLLPTWTYGIQLSIPVFDGLRREGRIAEQQAQVRELDVRKKDLVMQAEVEVRQALYDLASARESVDAARERLRLGQQEVAQATERFRAGVAGNADVITASFTLNSARSQQVDALTALQAARVALARAEGAITQLR